MRPKIIIAVLALGLVILGGLYLVQRGQPQKETTARQALPTTPSPPEKPKQEAQVTPPPSEPQIPTSKQFNLDQAPATIRPVVDLKLSIWDRYRLSRALPKTLSEQELEALSAFLREPHDEDAGQMGHALKNDLMDALCAQTPVPKDLDNLFAEIYRDHTQNIVIRDYAVQHLALLYERLDDPAARPAAGIQAEKREVEAVLWEAVAEIDSGITGTALLSLARLSETDNALDRDRIASAAFRMAQDEGASEPARITALQVCARMQAKEALPLLVQTAMAAPSTSLQISAIGALGLLGGEPEMQVLEKMATSDNPRLKPVANVALRRVQLRLAK